MIHAKNHVLKEEVRNSKEEVSDRKPVSVKEKVELFDVGARQGESSSSSNSKMQDKVNSLLKLKHPTNFKVTNFREKNTKVQINFWENWGVNKKNDN